METHPDENQPLVKRAYRCARAEFEHWLVRLSEQLPLWFPQREGEVNWNFQRAHPATSFDLTHYRPTVVPPGRHIMPDQEILFEFRRTPEGGIEFIRQESSEAQVLAGVRPCDLRAIGQMDAVHGAEPADTHYLEKRRSVTLVAFNCLQPCDERAFCAATGSLHTRQGADLFVTGGDGFVLVEVLSEAGKRLLDNVEWEEVNDAEQQREALERHRPDPFGRQLLESPERLIETLRGAYHSPVWSRYAELCFSCGTCNLVCPTCYCFDVCDELALDGQSGRRTRTWDGCMIPDFAQVAGNHNFRAGCADRQRHRIKRKFEYLPQRFPLGSFCVGCGRCGRQCTTGIDIFDMVNDIVREKAATS
ncbi:MAG: 4Fe-4S dicluster domain-containing protein [Gammaproteobacteria bacterium]